MSGCTEYRVIKSESLADLDVAVSRWEGWNDWGFRMDVADAANGQSVRILSKKPVGWMQACLADGKLTVYSWATWYEENRRGQSMHLDPIKLGKQTLEVRYIYSDLRNEQCAQFDLEREV